MKRDTAGRTCADRAHLFIHQVLPFTSSSVLLHSLCIVSRSQVCSAIPQACRRDYVPMELLLCMEQPRLATWHGRGFHPTFPRRDVQDVGSIVIRSFSTLFLRTRSRVVQETTTPSFHDVRRTTDEFRPSKASSRTWSDLDRFPCSS